MNEEAESVYKDTKQQMESAIKHLERELLQIRAGKANPSMLDGVKVESYGTLLPLNQLSSISTPDPRTILVQPWDKNTMKDIEKAIMSANLGFNPQNDGTLIRITVPALTEERRKDLVKKAKEVTENAKISIRNIRKSANDAAKKLEKDGLAEDETNRLENEIQKLTDKYTEKADEYLEAKENDIMTV
ncbi:MAG: ribosome recycling factor [Bacteroidales bacterium]|nr:ribosome recycling factor [Bacteroidales bacterium]MCF8328328.1 ribosome recycling factor [Bacteroidales bacterium]